MGHSTRKYSSGLTLIETMVGSALFLVVALFTYQAFGTLMDAVVMSKAKIAATALANEKFEIIRNLPYADVGIISGLPAGKLTKNETTNKDNYTFNVVTTIRNVDDPFDGTIGGVPNDNSPADYKLVDLDITCTNCKVFNPLNFTTLVAPRAIESASGGALFIRAFDASGVAVSGASVHIVNTQTNPDTIIDEVTDNDGWVKIIGATAGTNAYNISVTKSGYSTDQTYPVDGAAGANPTKPDSTVTTGSVTQVSFAIDRLSNLNVSTVNASCAALPSIGFSLTGTKLIGTPSNLKYTTQNFNTNASGELTIPNLEWDTYSTLLTSSSYNLAGVNATPSFSINPNEDKSVQLIVVPHVNRAILITVKDSAGNPINGADVRLQKSGFDQTKTTSATGACPTPGQAFWNGLASGTYTVRVTKSGYQTYNSSSFSMNNGWQQMSITLNP